MKLVPLLIFFLSISLIALDDKAAKKIEDVYTALLLKDESGESAPDNETALRILTELRINSSNLKSFERSAMWEAWGYLYYINDDYFSAIDAYTRLIEEPGTEKEKKTSTLLTLAQLNYLVENFESIPNEGSEITIGNYTFTAEQASETRIEIVLIKSD